MIKLFYIPIVILPLIAGCAAILSPQSGAGLTIARTHAQEFDATGRITKECSAEVRDGKERNEVLMTGTLCGATFTYSAREENSFKAFEVRAAVEVESMNMLGKVLPEIVDAGVTAASRAFVGSSAVGAARDAFAAKAGLEAARLKIEAAKAAPR